MNNSDGPKDRIIRAAYRLFYRNGFSETGINKILEQSGSHKASLYRYFDSKDKLGLVTLNLEKERFLSFLSRALQKYRHYPAFVSFWVKTVKRTMTGNFSRGCPFVRYSQTSGKDSFFNGIIRQVFADAEKLLAGYFIRNRRLEKPEAVLAARKALAAYEGAVQMVILSGDTEYFDIMEDCLLAVI
ncbi:MAG: TetR/AcrR family transcriptional regulator [Spirochaetales bacterium]|nr:TetR/AcrR family transcriptional regulator [Spirochaetales bacterium]